MEYIVENVPLWTVTTWDKNFSGVERSWQPNTIKYKYLLSDELDRLNVGGNVRLLYTGKDIGYTTEDLAGDAICDGEIVSIPWGGTPTIKYYKGKFVTGDNRIATSSKPNELLNKYLYYYLNGHLDEIASYYRGAGLKHPAMKDVLKMKISYPTVRDQETIIKSFERIENIIKQRQQQLQKLDELVKARFVEMFGDVITGDYKYQTRKLGEVAEVKSSHRVFTTEFVDEGVPFYRGTEIGELANGIKPKNPYRITKEHYDRLSSDETKPKIGDLLMPSICNKGQVWMVNTEEPFYYKDGRVLCISPNRELFNCKYLEQFMREKTMMEYPKLGSGSTFAEFKIFLLKDIDVLIPPIELQNQFADFVTQIDKSKFVVQKALDEAQSLFDSLMQKYFG